ncbi:MAG: HlyD family secretion protein [Verrucomicrobiales bacterium]
MEPSDPGLLDSRAPRAGGGRARQNGGGGSERASANSTAPGKRNALPTPSCSAPPTSRKGFVPGSEFDRLQFEARTAGDDVRGAEHAVQIAAFELEQARAALMLGSGAGEPDAAAFPIRSPISGKVLRVMQESSLVVAPGAPLVELGDPSDLEIVVDVLSSDGVKIDPGAAVKLEHWGGDAPLDAEGPAGRTRRLHQVSALGVEEQRVDVIIDFVRQEDLRASLGDGFRVEARIAIWDGKGVLKIPVGALFREAIVGRFRRQPAAPPGEGGRTRAQQQDRCRNPPPAWTKASASSFTPANRSAAGR